MKKFLTTREACNVLKKINECGVLGTEDVKNLSSIRVCLLAQELNINLWGKEIEIARPLFRGCEVPEEDASEFVKENYTAYLECLKESQKELQEEQ